MNVVFLSHSFPRSHDDPVGSFVLRLAEALVKRGPTVRVIAPSAPGLPRHEQLDGVEVHRFRYAPARRETLAYTGTMREQVHASAGARLFMATFLAAGFIAALRRASHPAADVIHAHWWFPGGVVGAALSAARRVPLVTTLHGSDVRLALGGGVPRRMFGEIIRRSNTVTTVSTWLARETRSLVPGAEPIVAPMPIAAGLFYPGGSRDSNSLLFVGKLNVQKGIAHLLQALAIMRHRPRVDIVVGVGSDQRESRRLAAELGVTQQLRWHALLTQAELADFYRSRTVLAMPAIDEGLGLVAAEALLCGMPVVAFASGGVTDLVTHEETGLLVPPGNDGELAAALDSLLDRPDRGAGLGHEGRLRTLRTFGADAVAERYLEIYKEAIDRRA